MAISGGAHVKDVTLFEYANGSYVSMSTYPGRRGAAKAAQWLEEMELVKAWEAWDSVFSSSFRAPAVVARGEVLGGSITGVSLAWGTDAFETILSSTYASFDRAARAPFACAISVFLLELAERAWRRSVLFVFGDLKDENVLFRGDLQSPRPGDLKMIDFGPGGGSQTPLYAHPRRKETARPTRRDAIFSIATLYFVVKLRTTPENVLDMRRAIEEDAAHLDATDAIALELYDYARSRGDDDPLEIDGVLGRFYEAAADTLSRCEPKNASIMPSNEAHDSSYQT
jgi:hypothetical protein